ncbi:hypothetical protein GIB67_023117 [Kingdonia uniflora]|uniref:Uncharacterized protein n=1 Tax=Kingdonia uniflora TaxID=39325 RepID=A0A7J7M5Q0_9MAGN|nr:hypothetical protein GIB67_023117 [Kingdonia uniflora]
MMDLKSRTSHFISPHTHTRINMVKVVYLHHIHSNAIVLKEPKLQQSIEACD